MSVPDLIEPVLAWRYWRVVPETRQLLSREIWPHYQALEARHQMHTLQAWQQDYDQARERMLACTGSPCPPHMPNVLPGCGIYGFKEGTRLFVELGHQEQTQSMVVGRVALWGRLIEHEDGWRGQYGYPHDFVYAWPTALGPQLAAAYGVPYQEDPSWKSAIRSVDSYPSPCATLSPSRLAYNPAFLRIFPQAPTLQLQPSQPSPLKSRASEFLDWLKVKVAGA